MAKEEKKEPTEKPNVQWIGRNAKGELREAFPFVNTPAGKIRLPDTKTQAAGFYHKKGPWLRQTFPQFYKEPVKKGEKQ